MSSIQDGTYSCKATGKSEYGISGKGTDQIAVEIDVLDGSGASLGFRTVYLSFSDNAASYAIEKLRALGFNGSRLDDLVGLGSAAARCSAKTEPDRDGNPRQSWDVFGGSGKAFKTEMSAADRRRLGDRFAKALGGTAPAGEPDAGSKRFDDVPFLSTTFTKGKAMATSKKAIRNTAARPQHPAPVRGRRVLRMRPHSKEA